MKRSVSNAPENVRCGSADLSYRILLIVDLPVHAMTGVEFVAASVRRDNTDPPTSVARIAEKLGQSD